MFRWILHFLRLFTLSLICFFSFNQTFAANTISPGIIVKKDTKHDVSLPLRYLQGKGNLDKLLPYKSVRQNLLEEALALEPTQPVNSLLIPLTGFQGMGIGLGNYQVTHPAPESNGSAGMTQYLQFVLDNIAVFDKTTHQLASGFPKPSNALWEGFGGACETNSEGRMSVKYDQLAHRWVISQYATVDIDTGPFLDCVAVSTSEDATGTYHRYSFELNSFSDFSRLGLWPDAYYQSFNMRGRAATGPLICALERDKMILGLPASIICKQLNTAESGPLLPADLDGQTTPPMGNPEYFMGLGTNGRMDNLVLFKFHVDFANPINTDVSQVNVPVSAFTKVCGNTNGAQCAVQPNTSNRLDIVGDRLMSRLAYRQFPEFGSMVVNHTVEGPQPKFAPAIRWYEFRVFNNTPSQNPIVNQQATHATDSKNRFVGSIAMDKMGNIALGYTVSSTAVHPSPEMGWRSDMDPINTLTIQPLVTGLGSQIDGVSNWNTSTVMSLDPVDDCTFWYTNEYLKTTGSMNWSTFILNFKLPGCVS